MVHVKDIDRTVGFVGLVNHDVPVAPATALEGDSMEVGEAIDGFPFGIVLGQAIDATLKK